MSIFLAQNCARQYYSHTGFQLPGNSPNLSPEEIVGMNPLPQADPSYVSAFQRDAPKLTHSTRGRLPDLGISGELTFVVADPGKRRKPRGARSIVVDRVLPPRSFLKVDESIWVCSPALTAITCAMADPDNLVRQVLITGELCSAYAWGSNANGEQKLAKRSLITSADHMEKYFREFRIENINRQQLHGYPLALEALRYVTGGARSPMENVLGAFLACPPFVGCLGLRDFECNAAIPLGEKGKRAMKTEYVVGDFVDFERCIVVEYDGGDHAEFKRMNNDSARDKALREVGFETIRVTSDQMFKPEQLDLLADNLAAKLPVRSLVGRRSPQKTKAVLRSRFCKEAKRFVFER